MSRVDADPSEEQGRPVEPPLQDTAPGEERPGGGCHRCGAAVVEGSQVCSTCGQKQFRVCSCGVAFPSDRTRCPACGTDCTRSVVRRRSRSHRSRRRGLLRSAVLGACLALMLSGLLNWVITALAQRAGPEGNVAAHMGEWLYYAWQALGTAVAALITRLFGGLGYTALIAAAGAGLGALAYVLPGWIAGLRRSHRHNSRSSRVRRRLSAR